MRASLRYPALFTAGALALCLPSCNTAPASAEAAPAVDVAALTAQVQAMEDAYAAASTAKDADAVMNYYADDVISYSHQQPPMEGKASLRARMAERMAKDTLGITPSFKVLELFVGTDHLTEIGSWTDTDKSGAVVDYGTYFSVFRKSGTGWACIRDIAVSNKPKEAAAQ